MAAIGRREQQLARAFRIVAGGAAAGAYAGAVAAVGGAGGLIDLQAFGDAVRTAGAAGAARPRPESARPETRFDLASLTKLFTATALLQEVDAGRLWLDVRVAELIEEFRHSEVRLRHLLTHTSGLPAWRPLYLEARGTEQVVTAICREELAREPGREVIYSDLGYILLGRILERTDGMALAQLFRRRILEPLGMSATGFGPLDPALPVAATEHGNRIETAMCGEVGSSFPRWRREVIRGEANDGNAFYALDGAAGHAGLFGTAADLARFAGFWLTGAPRILSPSARREAARVQAAGSIPWGWGWIKPGQGYGAFLGDLVSPSAFGHTGFTGTSLAIDPERGFYAVLLTNWQHVAQPDSAGIARIRRSFHNALSAAFS